MANGRDSYGIRAPVRAYVGRSIQKAYSFTFRPTTIIA